MKETLKLYREVISIERDALSRVMDHINEVAVEKALEYLIRCTGKVVLIGVGKSGLIARKLAATYSSLGIPSTFMHASDALHGDLGIISKNDVTILLSNSGKTDEINLLLPHLKSRDIPRIAIVGNLESDLANASDVALYSGVEKEADPNNLAPTSSTTVQLAIGDALGVATATVRGITPRDFAINHPAGRLGKQLTLKVKDLMHSGQRNPIILSNENFEMLLESFSKYQLGAVNVVDEDMRLIGIVTDGDMRRAYKLISDFKRSVNVEAIMTVNPLFVSPNENAIESLKLMENRDSQISVLPVVDRGKCVGLIRVHDLIKAGL